LALGQKKRELLLQIRAAEDAKAKNGGMEGQLKNERAEKEQLLPF